MFWVEAGLEIVVDLADGDTHQDKVNADVEFQHPGDEGKQRVGLQCRCDKREDHAHAQHCAVPALEDEVDRRREAGL